MPQAGLNNNYQWMDSTGFLCHLGFQWTGLTFANLLKFDICYCQALQSYLDAEGSPHAPFILPENVGMMKLMFCFALSSFLQVWLLGRPTVSILCISAPCLNPSCHICPPAWTLRPAPVCRVLSIPLFHAVIISLGVTQDQGPGQRPLKKECYFQA